MGNHPALLALEALHRLWLGPLFFPIYGILFLFTGYRQHPLERDAYAWEEKQRSRMS